MFELMWVMVMEGVGRLLIWWEVFMFKFGLGEVWIVVFVCGVCCIDFYIVDGELIVLKFFFIFGYEIVGIVEMCGEGVIMFVLGECVGVLWLGWMCGVCLYCLYGCENLCDYLVFIGYMCDGGYV